MANGSAGGGGGGGGGRGASGGGGGGGGGGSGSGSLERTKRPDQQLYQTRRNISTERTGSGSPAFGQPAAAAADPTPPRRVDNFHRVVAAPAAKQQQSQPQQQQQQRPGGAGGVRMNFTEPTVPAAAPQHSGRSTENPFTRNLTGGGGGGRIRRDSNCSEVSTTSSIRPADNQQKATARRSIVAGGGGVGGGVGGGGGGNQQQRSMNKEAPGGGRIWLPNNIETLPPRFQKKYLAAYGLDAGLLDKPRTNGVIVDPGQARFIGKPNIVKTFANTRVIPDRAMPPPPEAESQRPRTESFRRREAESGGGGGGGDFQGRGGLQQQQQQQQRPAAAQASMAAPPAQQQQQQSSRRQGRQAQQRTRTQRRDQQRDRSDRTDRTDWTDRSHSPGPGGREPHRGEQQQPQQQHSGRSSAMSAHRGEQQQQQQPQQPQQQQRFIGGTAAAGRQQPQTGGRDSRMRAGNSASNNNHYDEERVYYSTTGGGGRQAGSTSAELSSRFNALNVREREEREREEPEEEEDDGALRVPFEIALPPKFDWNDDVDGMYDNSDADSISFRSELSATVSTMNDYYARHNPPQSAASASTSAAAVGQSQQQQQKPPSSALNSSASGQPPNRPPSAASSVRSLGNSQQQQQQPQSMSAAGSTQSLPRPKSRSSRRSGRRSGRSSRTGSFDRQSMVSLNDDPAPQQQQQQQQPKTPQRQPQRAGLLVLDSASAAAAKGGAGSAQQQPPPLQSTQLVRAVVAAGSAGGTKSRTTLLPAPGSPARAAAAASGAGGLLRPTWYDPAASEKPATVQLVRQLERADHQLQAMLQTDEYLTQEERFARLRADMLQLYAQLMTGDVKFAYKHSLETHMWKTLYYNQIEAVKRRLGQVKDPAAAAAALEQDQHLAASKRSCMHIVDEGLATLECMLHQLEETFGYQLDSYIDLNAGQSKAAVGTMRVALFISEALLLHLGDLARYREQLQGTKQFGRSKQWYTKAQHLMPTNGKPFNSLAVISIQMRRRFESIYFHMRSICASNPIESARESLKVMLDENRKKYETAQRKWDEAHGATGGDSSAASSSHLGGSGFDGRLRRELWIHPEGGRRIYRTSALNAPAAEAAPRRSSEQRMHDELCAMDQDELNRRFIVSYLHVQGKLLTKIGMDSFQSCSRQMLHEMYLLLQRTPTVFASTRIVQLTALNMFAILNLRTREIKPNPDQPTPRNDAQTNALCMSLAMFTMIIDRVTALLRESIDKIAPVPPAKVDVCDAFNEDARILLPAIKIWCDWLLVNDQLWNPPPTLHAFAIRCGTMDPWSSLAALLNQLERVQTSKRYILIEANADSELVRLPEDIALLGFEPLGQHNGIAPVFCDRSDDLDMVHTVYRMKRIVFLCTKCFTRLEPPVLERREPSVAGGLAEYRSAVTVGEEAQAQGKAATEKSTAGVEDELMLETFSDEEAAQAGASGNSTGTEDIGDGEGEVHQLVRRKDELQKRQHMHAQSQQRLQEILRKSTYLLHIEVRPKYLVPDTNCFIDFAAHLQRLSRAHPVYQLVVPLVVIKELEGLSLGNRSSHHSQEHTARVMAAAQEALIFLRDNQSALSYVTTKGSIMSNRTQMQFTNEESIGELGTNDDRILLTAVNLNNMHTSATVPAAATTAGKGSNSTAAAAIPTQSLLRKVVLLTHDRNLRVKALAQNMPVRELPDFIRWSGLPA